MKDTKEAALILILSEMAVWLDQYDTESEIYAELVKALDICGVELRS